MNQFKPLFLGTVDPRSDLASFRRAVNSQKCIRVGGKHNDLEEVGQDLTHHTFFEMLGSWSFGDYFKEHACRMALELLTSVYHLPVDRLYFTYFGGCPQLGLQPDNECRDIWRSLGVPAGRILPFGTKDNFWDMGDTGPCGSCTEIHFDHLGNSCRAAKVNADSPDLVEIWNLVFMQYERHEDGSLSQLPRQHVDTGMGFERLLAVLNGTRSNYDSDLFLPLFAAIHKTSGADPYGGRVGKADIRGLDTAYRIMADHARMYTVAIADGLVPSRTGLGHKLRQLVYKCVRHAQRTFNTDPRILSDLVDVVAQSLGEAFPEIQAKKELVKSTVNMTVEGYVNLYQDANAAFVKMMKRENSRHISGDTICQLSDGYYGCQVPIDLVVDLAHQHGLTLDLTTLEQRRLQEKEQQSNAPLVSKAILSQQCYVSLRKQGVKLTDDSFKYAYFASPVGYDFSECNKLSCRVEALFEGGEVVTQSSRKGAEVAVILDKTCFYAESGGQISDVGTLVSQSGELAVQDVQEFNCYVVHLATLTSGVLNAGDLVTPFIELKKRVLCMRNHTATHLLQAALKQHSGVAVCQHGSTVRPDRLTFDFLCLEKLTGQKVTDVENTVRQFIGQRHAVHRHLLPLTEAVSRDDIIMMPNEDYPAEVTVVQIGDGNDAVSKELCGGTHVQSTADVVDFCITRVGTVSRGVWRVTAITGLDAKHAHENGAALQAWCDEFSSLVTAQQSSGALLAEKSQRIKQLSETDLLPSTIRQLATSVVGTLGQHVTAATNRERQLELRRVVENLLRQDPHCSVHSATFDGKQMVKALSTLSVSKPVALISCDKKSASVVILLPTEQALADIQATLTRAVGESNPMKFKSTVNEHGATLVQVSVKGSNLKDSLASSVREAINHLASSTSSR